jgi:hypothetical protein
MITHIYKLKSSLKLTFKLDPNGMQQLCVLDRHDAAHYTQAHIAAAYHRDPVIQEPTAPINTGKYINIYTQCMDPGHKVCGHTGRLTHHSDCIVLCYIVRAT